MTNPDNVGGLPEPVGWRVRLSERGNNPWGPSPWHLESSEPKPSPREFYDVEQLHTADQMRAYAELCRAAPAGGDDLYRQACDSVEEWKARALEAEADIARIHAQINAENGPTFMGEPVVSAPAGSGEVLAHVDHPECNHCYALSMDRAAEEMALLRAWDEPSGEAPETSLPDWGECQLRVSNSKFLAERIATGSHGPEHGDKLATELHRFIYEYDDADRFRSGWFLHRLERVLNEHAALLRKLQQGADGWRPIESAPKDGTEFDVWCPTPDGGYRVANTWWCQTDRKFRTYGDNYCTWAHQPTHWREHPDAPASQGQEGGHG